jgi:hypothetical protein
MHFDWKIKQIPPHTETDGCKNHWLEMGGVAKDVKEIRKYCTGSVNSVEGSDAGEVSICKLSQNGRFPVQLTLYRIIVWSAGRCGPNTDRHVAIACTIGHV